MTLPAEFRERCEVIATEWRDKLPGRRSVVFGVAWLCVDRDLRFET